MALIRKNRYFIITICIMVFIFVQSALNAAYSDQESGILVNFTVHITGWDPEPTTFFVRKTAHFTEYMILGISLVFSVQDAINRSMCRIRSETKACMSAWIIGIVYAMTDEIHQIFVDGRSGSVRDVCIDAAGTLAGILVTLCIRKMRKAKKKKQRKENI